MAHSRSHNRCIGQKAMATCPALVALAVEFTVPRTATSPTWYVGYGSEAVCRQVQVLSFSNCHVVLLAFDSIHPSIHGSTALVDLCRFSSFLIYTQ
jgi:hypothetical protein